MHFLNHIVKSTRTSAAAFHLLVIWTQCAVGKEPEDHNKSRRIEHRIETSGVVALEMCCTKHLEKRLNRHNVHSTRPICNRTKAECEIHRIYEAPALASSAATTAGFTFFLPSFQRTRGGGARLRRPSRDRTRTTAPEESKDGKKKYRRAGCEFNDVIV